MGNKNNFWYVFLFVFLIFLFGFTIMATRLGGFMMFGVGIMSMFMIFPLLFLIGFGFLIYYLVTDSRPINNINNDEDDALRVLKLRYAKGEISEHKYESMKRELRK